MSWSDQDEVNHNDMNIPHPFRCPISLDIFKDPVTLSTGQTYERTSIQKWLAEGNQTCPVTMQKLQDLTMVPNHTLRHLIHQWLLMGTWNPDPAYVLNPDDSLAGTKSQLQSPDTPFLNKIQTLRRIRKLYDECEVGRSYLIKHDFIALLLELSLGTSCTYSRLEELLIAEESLPCVLNLSASGKMGFLNIIREESKLRSFGNLFERGNTKVKTMLCYLIEAISSSDETRELCIIMGQSQHILRCTVSLMEQGVDQKASDAAVKAIFGLSGMDLNRENIVREGGIRALIMYLRNTDKRLVSRALRTLEILLQMESGKRALRGTASAAEVLVKMVFRISDLNHGGCDSAVSSLLVICRESSSFRKEVICSGAVTQLLLLLQSQCNEKTKCKARELLKLLRSTWDKTPKLLSRMPMKT